MFSNIYLLYLLESALKLVSRDVKMTDYDIYKFRDELRKRKSQLNAKWGKYFELILDRSIDLSDAIKETKTLWGNDLLSLREQRKHLDWLEKSKKFLKASLAK